jgi:hypothetical protein
MKRLMLMIAGLFTLTVPLLAGSIENDPADAAERGRKIKISLWIEFGRASRDCAGFGICDWGFTVTLDNAVHKLTATQAGVEGYFDDDGKFVIDFLKDYMLDETFETYLSNGFTMEEDAPIPPEILQKLEYRGNYTIRAGTYSFRQAPDRYIVKF